MTGFIQKIIAFFAAIAAFFSGLFGINNKPETPEDPETEVTTVAEEQTENQYLQIISGARTILSNPGGTYNYFGWPSIARLQNGKLAVTCSGFRRGHVCPFGQAVMITSEDEGVTWSAPRAIIETPLDDRDAGVVPFGENGVIVTSFNNTREFQRRSNPNSPDYLAYIDTVTDEDEAKYLGSTFRLSSDGGETFGDIHISPVTSPHGPTALRDGTLLWVGRNFDENDEFEESDRIQAWKINPDGTMTFVGEVPPVYRNGVWIAPSEPYTIELPDGTLLCHYRGESGTFTIFETRSTDGGATWTLPEQLLPDMGGSPPHLLLHSSGTLICAYGYRQAPYGVRLMLSADLGQTWKTDIVLWDKGFSADLGYPATVELTDGSLLTVFYAEEEAGGPCVIRQIRWRLVQSS